MPLKTALPVLVLGYRTGWPSLPHTVEGARLVGADTRVDYSATVDDLGLHGRSLAESMRDTAGSSRADTSRPAPRDGAARHRALRPQSRVIASAFSGSA
jgi:hypothetical protein